MRLVVLAALGCSLLCAQAPEGNNTKGAKSLFLDGTSGTAATPASHASQRQTGRAGSSSSGPVAQAVSLHGNPGLMYYVESATAEGGLERVTPSSVFHSGDRVRITIKTNTGGSLVISQRSSDGSQSVLFPDARVANGDNHINANQFTVLPSQSSWFRFDENPGEEKLFVILQPDATIGAEPPSIADERRFRPEPDHIASAVEHQRGSKALRIEVDPSPESGATYVVKPMTGELRQNDVVTAEITLIHR
jgi:hypothetical protein